MLGNQQRDGLQNPKPQTCSSSGSPELPDTSSGSQEVPDSAQGGWRSRHGGDVCGMWAHS